MKFTLVFTLIATLMHSGSSAPQPFISSILEQIISVPSSAVALAGDVTSDVAQNVAENFQKATLEFIDQAEDIAATIEEGSRNFLTNVFNNFTASVDALHSSLQEQLKSLSRGVRQYVVNEIDKALVRQSQNADRLQNLVLTLSNDVNENILRVEQDAQGGWNKWASEQLEAVASRTDSDEQAVQEADDIISEYVQRYSNQLSSCGDETQFYVQQFEDSVHQLIQEYQGVVYALKDQAEVCLSGEVTDLECLNGARDPLKELGRAPLELQKLVNQGVKLGGSDFSRNSCVVQTLVQSNLGKVGVQRQLLSIVKEANKRQSEQEYQSQ